MESRAVAATAALILGTWSADAGAWGPDGHSIIGEVAQHRLNPQATAEVFRLLGTNHSLASVEAGPTTFATIGQKPTIGTSSIFR